MLCESSRTLSFSLLSWPWRFKGSLFQMSLGLNRITKTVVNSPGPTFPLTLSKSRFILVKQLITQSCWFSQDLSAMKIGTSHRNKIWKSLVEYKQANAYTSEVSQSLARNASSTSTISLSSQPSISQNSAYCPGYYEVTRYTFKHTISITKDDVKKLRTEKPEWTNIWLSHEHF